MSQSSSSNDSRIARAIIIVSIVIPVAVAILFYMPNNLRIDLGPQSKHLPFFHALLNGTTAFLLVFGLTLIKRKKIKEHKAVMLTATALSAVFLVSYVISKLSTPPVPFGGEGFVRGLYFFVLISHIVLSVPVIPLALFSIFRGLKNDVPRHKKIVRFTFPIWLYVAVTGVLVYIFMSPYYPV